MAGSLCEATTGFNDERLAKEGLYPISREHGKNMNLTGNVTTSESGRNGLGTVLVRA
jgi:hypothetical protein